MTVDSPDDLSQPLLVAMLLGLMAAISLGSYLAYLHWDRVKKPMKKRTLQGTTNKNKTSSQPTRKTPRKSDKNSAEADKNEKASQPKTDIGKGLIKTAKKSPQATRKTPRKSDKKLAEADKNEKLDKKASQPKTDVGKELTRTAQNLEDIHEKIEESNKPVKGMDKLEKVKTAHDKLEKVKKELDEDK